MVWILRLCVDCQSSSRIWAVCILTLKNLLDVELTFHLAFFFFLTWMKTLIHERDRVRRGIARRVLKPCANLHRPVRDCLYWRQPKLFEWVWLPPRATCPSNACGVHFQADAVKCSQPCVWVFKVGSVENAE